MKKYRFYCPEITENQSVLDRFETHHLSHVLRMETGEQIELFDGKGKTAEAIIEKISNKQTQVKLSSIKIHQPMKPQIIIAVSLAKGQRFDFLVEKCTELGVNHIAAVQFERTVKMGKISVLDRYEKICITAAKQSGRVFLPDLSGPAPFSKTIDFLQKKYPKACWIYGDYNAKIVPLFPNNPGQNLIAVIGPEGGITDREKQLLMKTGASAASINPNVLRIETAAIAFSSILTAGRNLSSEV